MQSLYASNPHLLIGMDSKALANEAAKLGMKPAALKALQDLALDPKVSRQEKLDNGDLVFFDDRGNEVKRIKGFDTPKSSGTTIKSGGLTISGADISAGVKRLNDSGNDPSVYLEMYNTWKAKGGLPQDFTKAYPPEIYINPANTWLPRELVPKSPDGRPTLVL